jgi:hypothetical protein
VCDITISLIPIIQNNTQEDPFKTSVSDDIKAKMLQGGGKTGSSLGSATKISLKGKDNWLMWKEIMDYADNNEQNTVEVALQGILEKVRGTDL